MTARPQRRPRSRSATLLEQAGLRGNLSAGDPLEYFPDAALDALRRRGRARHPRACPHDEALPPAQV